MKRKQAPVASSSRKRAKQGAISPPVLPHPHGDVDYEKEYKVKSILDEKDRQYLIDWEDDEQTGEHYEPTWEPKSHANKQAVADWQRQKAAKLRLAPPTTPKPKRKPGRPRRVIVSSPEESPELSQKQLSQPRPKSLPQANGELEQEPEIVESEPEPVAGPEQPDSPLFEPVVGPVVEPVAEPVVEPSDPPSSFQAGGYLKFSSSQAAHSSGPVGTDPQPNSGASGEQSRSVPVNFGERSSRVVPDSQSAVELSSSAPAATTSDEAPQHPSVILKIPGESQHTDASSAAPGKAANEEAPPGPATQPPSESLVEREPVASTVSQSETPDSAERNRPAPEEVSSPSAVTQPSAEQTTQDPTQALQSSEVPKFPAEVSNHPPAATPVSSGVQLQDSNGRASVIRTPGPFQTQQSLPSSFPFQTQIAACTSTSGPVHSPLQIGSQIRPLSAITSGGRASSLPPGQYSPTRSSSPFPSVPSHLTGTLGESPPPRPNTPSSPLSVGTPSSARIMETSQNSQRSATSDKLAKLIAIQERGRASRQRIMTAGVPKSVPSRSEGASDSLGPRSRLPQASPALPLSPAPKLVSSLIVAEQDRRSPSSVPAIGPLPVITQEEMNTSERYETLVPRAQEAGTTAPQRNGSVTGAGKLIRQPTMTEEPQSSYVVPIALIGHQRDQYQQTFFYYHSKNGLIQRFLAAANPDAELAVEAEHFVERMRRVTLHPDLDNAETLTQYNVEPNMQAQWDVDCSAKFRFLKALFDGVRDQTLHVAVVAQPSRVVEMLATFLTAITVPHRRLADVTETSPASDHDGLMVTLVSLDDNIHDAQPSPADLVIAMSPVVSLDCMPIKAFIHMGDRRPPLIILVVPGSVEHVEYSVSPVLAGGARLRTLVSGICQHRNEAGKLEDDQLAPELAAEAIARYFAAQEGRGKWPLATLGTLADLDSQTESDLEPASIDDTNGSGTAENRAAGVKRTFGSDDSMGDVADAGKKARYESPTFGEMPGLPMTINPHDLEITHVSDSVHKPTQLSTFADAEAAAQSSLLSDTEQRLRSLLEDAQNRLVEHIEALSGLQFRHEEQREKLIEVTNQRDIAISTAQQAVNRITETAKNTSTLKAERTALKQQLEEANAKLLDHSVPERAEFEALRLAAAQTKTEKEQLDKRLLSARDENEYLRSNYQTSSQTAQNLASQNTELENELAVAQNKATGEQVKLRQMGYDSQTKSLRDENKKLKALLKDRDAGLKFRDEEIAKLKEASRGRMGTRGTSVPRSPRLGSPMKMDGLRGRGSRQESPAAGEPKGKAGHLHPLRNG
ncbi:hypothetical protein LTR36_004433 [Oleoguttula mirabilis]|uniref:Chromo domain-containing protein n=1 Tax=Oleoguttula mirabilis TaxID=1507867 RepID=A0AAV9JG86_9PEZI|nr:hypothetical protein LTR36_004433 [Oleoguttula mirabilis]